MDVEAAKKALKALSSVPITFAHTTLVALYETFKRN